MADINKIRISNSGITPGIKKAKKLLDGFHRQTERFADNQYVPQWQRGSLTAEWVCCFHSPVAAGWGWHRTSDRAPATRVLALSRSLALAAVAESASVCHPPWLTSGPEGAPRRHQNLHKYAHKRHYLSTRITDNRQRVHPILCRG